MRTELLLTKLVKFLELRKLKNGDRYDSDRIALTKNECKAVIAVLLYFQKALELFGKPRDEILNTFVTHIERSERMSDRDRVMRYGIDKKIKEIVPCYSITDQLIPFLNERRMTVLIADKDFLLYLEEVINETSGPLRKAYLSFRKYLFSNKMEKFSLEFVIEE